MTSSAIVLIGLVSVVLGTVMIDNLNLNSPPWLFSLLSMATVIGAVLVVLGALGFLVNAALADRFADEHAYPSTTEQRDRGRDRI